MIPKPQTENYNSFILKNLISFPKIYLQLLGLMFIFIPFSKASGNMPLENNKVYKVAIDKEFEPYEFLNQDNAADGFTPSILLEIGNRSNVSFEFYPMTWVESIKALRNGQVDLINMIYSDERATTYEFSEPYCEITQALFHNDQIRDIVGPTSLGGYKVGFQKDDISLSYMDSVSNSKRYLFDTKLDGFLQLNIGKIDAFFCAEQVGINLISKYKLKNIDLACG